jgi:hypothetical protein
MMLALVSSSFQTAPASPPDPAATTTAAGAPSAAPSIKPIKKRFLLSRSSPVYQQPDSTSAVVTHVKSRTHVNVIGISGDWLQVKLPSGKVGSFLPTP